MKFSKLLEDLTVTWAERNKAPNPVNPQVVLIVNGVAYDIADVWWEPTQGRSGAICIGYDPR